MMTKEANGAANHRMTNNINANMFISSSASATPPPTSAAMKYMADTNGSATASTSAAPKTPGRSPRKKLDALLRMAEARAAANGQAVKAEQEDGAGGAENGDGGGGTQTQQRMGAGQADGGATSSSSSSSGYSSSSTNVSSASNNGRQGQQIHVSCLPGHLYLGSGVSALHFLFLNFLPQADLQKEDWNVLNR